MGNKTKKRLTKNRLKKQATPYREVETSEGTALLKRMDLRTKGAAMDLASRYRGEDDKINESRMLEFGMDMIALSICEDYDQLMFDPDDYQSDEEGHNAYAAAAADARPILEHFHLDELYEMAVAVIDLNGLDVNVEAKKKL